MNKGLPTEYQLKIEITVNAENHMIQNALEEFEKKIRNLELSNEQDPENPYYVDVCDCHIV